MCFVVVITTFCCNWPYEMSSLYACTQTTFSHDSETQYWCDISDSSVHYRQYQHNVIGSNWLISFNIRNLLMYLADQFHVDLTDNLHDFENGKYI